MGDTIIDTGEQTHCHCTNPAVTLEFVTQSLALCPAAWPVCGEPQPAEIHLKGRTKDWILTQNQPWSKAIIQGPLAKKVLPGEVQSCSQPAHVLELRHFPWKLKNTTWACNQWVSRYSVNRWLKPSNFRYFCPLPAGTKVHNGIVLIFHIQV